MNLFKGREKQAQDPTVETEAEEGAENLAAKDKVQNPYLNARRSWNGHVMGLMSSIQMWQAVGIAGLLIGVGAVGGIAHIGAQSKIIPMVVEQDSSGNTVSVTLLERVPDAVLTDYQTAVANFIVNTRMVTPDIALQRKAILAAYAYLAPQDPATQKTNEYLNGSPERHPYKRAENETVSVEIKSVLPQTKESWQVDWTETVRSRDGRLKGEPYNMRALVTVYQNKDTVVDQNTFVNGHFIFIRDYNWSKQL
ncbi:VirB8/TrbF family protein [Pseudomonas syringae]|uniref:VirB8/TrbF family protein n=1 Tax=Pseudomonas syringae TaxID=317 RepID=UPI0002098DE8|nr:VirB8/TrbF family protein [Pseudomonas syringae]MDP5168586.1 VirB8/TrbF family protein [Pseudomonas syringae pv. aptata str. DSM 50252]